MTDLFGRRAKASLPKIEPRLVFTSAMPKRLAVVCSDAFYSQMP